jgi:hypothetical protein
MSSEEGVNHVTGIHLSFTSAPDKMDSDRLRAIFTPAGRAARVQIARAICRTKLDLGATHQNNKKGPTRGPFVVWRARQDSNL